MDRPVHYGGRTVEDFSGRRSIQPVASAGKGVSGRLRKGPRRIQWAAAQWKTFDLLHCSTWNIWGLIDACRQLAERMFHVEHSYPLYYFALQDDSLRCSRHAHRFRPMHAG